MRVFFVVAAMASLAGCSGYDGHELELLTAMAAKEYCSCAFVLERSHDDCLRYATSVPELVRISVGDDDGRPVVTATSGLFWGQRARYVDARFGCVLED